MRTRQEGVPFVTCEDSEAVAATALPLLGSRIQLQAMPDGVTITRAQGDGSSSKGAPAAAAAAKPAAQAAAVQKVRSVSILPLADATAATGGAKAASCGELLRLAASCSDAATSPPAGNGKNGSSGTPILSAPDGVVLPFGCMEAAVAADGQQQRLDDLLSQLKSVLGSMQGGSSSSGSLAALDGICSDIQLLLAGLRIPQSVRASWLPLLGLLCLRWLLLPALVPAGCRRWRLLCAWQSPLSAYCLCCLCCLC